MSLVSRNPKTSPLANFIPLLRVYYMTLSGSDTYFITELADLIICIVLSFEPPSIIMCSMFFIGLPGNRLQTFCNIFFAVEGGGDDGDFHSNFGFCECCFFFNINYFYFLISNSFFTRE